jgi:Transcriptional regulators
MAVTAKEIAKILDISPAAVSIALNNKPGVSEETRQRVQEAAKRYGYLYSNAVPSIAVTEQRKISLVIFKKTGGKIIEDTPFFSKLTEGIAAACKSNGYLLDIRYLYEQQNVEAEVKSILLSKPEGIILLATEMKECDFDCFNEISIPIVVLDTYFETIAKDYVLINNVQGAFLATNYMINMRNQQPGYLRSAYSISNFEERADGFYKAVRNNKMSSSSCVVHKLTPTMEGAYSDMKKLLSEGAKIANCYFADNDLIAAGAIHAFKDYGYRIPEDIAIIGFDNTSLCEIIEPTLTTINVPKETMGSLAVNRLVSLIGDRDTSPVKIEITTNLVIRESL